jgi:hypothetical protein
MVDVKGWLKKDGLKKDELDREKVGRTSKKQKSGKSVRMSVRRMYPSFIVLLVLIWALNQGKHRAIADWAPTYASPPWPRILHLKIRVLLRRILKYFVALKSVLLKLTATRWLHYRGARATQSCCVN